jgi:AraC family transcriptional regulator
MLMTAIPAVEAYQQACRRQPSVTQNSPTRRRVGLYGWRTGATQEVHIPEAQELVLSVHLGGAQRVRVFTEEGLSRSFSKPGDVTLIPRGKAVSYRTDGEVEFATLHFPNQGLRKGLGAALSRVQACHFAVPDDYIVSSVRTLMQVARAPSTASSAYVGALFEALTLHIAHLIEEGEQRPARLVQVSQVGNIRPTIDKVLQQIDRQLAEKLTLQSLAEMAGVCRTIFAEQFAKRMGCAPHQYIIQRRIERAKELLMEGRMSVTDIAYEVGFSGQSHLSTTFRATTGQSPSQYVAAQRHVICKLQN